jgi:hypothetical protein
MTPLLPARSKVGQMGHQMDGARATGSVDGRLLQGQILADGLPEVLLAPATLWECTPEEVSPHNLLDSVGSAWMGW